MKGDTGSVQLLVSFCNTEVRGFTLGVYDWDRDDLTWVDVGPIEAVSHEPPLGVDDICPVKDGYWLLPQIGEGSVSGIAHADASHKIDFCRRLTDTGDAHDLIPFEEGFLVTDTQRNRLMKVAVNGSDLTESEIWRGDPADHDAIHLNSVAMYGGATFVSVFGEKPADGWAQAKGGKIVNVTDGSTLCEGLAHPHSLAVFDGALWWLESKTGSLYRYASGGAPEIFVQVDGYARGLSHDENHLYVGISGQRVKSRSTGKTIASDEEAQLTASAVCRVDKRTKTIERRPLSIWGTEVYELVCLQPSRAVDWGKKTKFGGAVDRFQTVFLAWQEQIQVAMGRSDEIVKQSKENARLRTVIQEWVEIDKKQRERIDELRKESRSRASELEAYKSWAERQLAERDEIIGVLRYKLTPVGFIRGIAGKFLKLFGMR